MGRGMFLGGVVLGGLALFWGYLLLGVYTVAVAAGGDAAAFLPVPLAAFGAGVTSLAGAYVGLRRLRLASLLILLAGVVGVVAPVPALLANLAPDATVTGILSVYLTVGWWAIVMIWVGAGALIWSAREAAPRDAASGP